MLVIFGIKYQVLLLREGFSIVCSHNQVKKCWVGLGMPAKQTLFIVRSRSRSYGNSTRSYDLRILETLLTVIWCMALTCVCHGCMILMKLNTKWSRKKDLVRILSNGCHQTIALGDLKFNWIIIHFIDNLIKKDCMCNKDGVILDPSQNHCMDMENMLSF